MHLIGSVLQRILLFNINNLNQPLLLWQLNWFPSACYVLYISPLYKRTAAIVTLLLYTTSADCWQSHARASQIYTFIDAYILSVYFLAPWCTPTNCIAWDSKTYAEANDPEQLTTTVQVGSYKIESVNRKLLPTKIIIISSLFYRSFHSVY